MRTLRLSVIGVVLVAVSALGVAAQAEERSLGPTCSSWRHRLVRRHPGPRFRHQHHERSPRQRHVVVDYDYVCDLTMSSCSVWGEETITNDGGSWVGEFIGLIRSGPAWENNITAWLKRQRGLRGLELRGELLGRHVGTRRRKGWSLVSHSRRRWPWHGRGFGCDSFDSGDRGAGGRRARDRRVTGTTGRDHRGARR